VDQGLLERECNLDEASYFLSRTALVRTDGPGMRQWRKRLFMTLWRNAGSPIDYFRLAESRTVIMGERVEI
jgi:KUP system potassium uptake protein